MPLHVLDGLQFPETWPEDIPGSIQSVHEKALSKDVADRYQTAGEFAQAISELTAKTDSPGVVVVPPIIRQGKTGEEDIDAKLPPSIISVDDDPGKEMVKEMVKELGQSEDKKPNCLVPWGLVGIFGILALLIIVLLGVFGGNIFGGEEQAGITNTITQSPAEVFQPTDTVTPTPVKNTPASSSGQLSSPELTATPTRSSTPTQIPIAVVNVRNANIRSGPDTNFPLVGSAPEGLELLVVGRNRENTWLVVELDNNEQGWISIDFVDFSFSISTLPEINSPPTPTSPPPTPTAIPTKKPYGGAILLPPSLKNEEPVATASYPRQILSLSTFCISLFAIWILRKGKFTRQMRTTWKKSLSLFISLLSLG